MNTSTHYFQPLLRKISTCLVILSPAVQSGAQTLTEVKDIRIYEHHSNYPYPFGSHSAYDFVQHTYAQSTHPSGQPNDPTYAAEAPSRDLLELGGPYADPNKFGWTSGKSNIWSGTIYGNDLTTFLKSTSFDYANADANDIRDAFITATPTKTVSSPKVDDIYLVRIRNTDDYAVMKIKDWFYDSGTEVYFQFDYKYGKAVSPPNGIAPPQQDQIRIYPRPAIGHVVIDCPTGDCETLSIYSAAGRLVLNEPVQKVNDISSLPVGYFIARVRDAAGNIVFVDKLVKN